MGLKHVLKSVEERSSGETLSQLKQMKRLFLFIFGGLHLIYIREINIDI